MTTALLDGYGSRHENGINLHESGLHIDNVAVSASAAELNKMDGVTASTTEINKLAGATPTTAELNVLAGIATGVFMVGQKFTVQYPQVAAADVAKTFYTACAPCKIVSGCERHVTVAGQAGVLTVEKLTAGQAPGSGGDCFATGFDLTSTANTAVTKTAVTTAVGTLAMGDSLCLKLQSGAATSYALGTVTITMQFV